MTFVTRCSLTTSSGIRGWQKLRGSSITIRQVTFQTWPAFSFKMRAINWRRRRQAALAFPIGGRVAPAGAAKDLCAWRMHTWATTANTRRLTRRTKRCKLFVQARQNAHLVFSSSASVGRMAKRTALCAPIMEQGDVAMETSQAASPAKSKLPSSSSFVALSPKERDRHHPFCPNLQTERS
jgi:hypothetical protein